MPLSLLIPLTGTAMNALCIFIIRLLDKDFIEVYKKNANKYYCITYFIDGVKCHRNSMRTILCETQMKGFLLQLL